MVNAETSIIINRPIEEVFASLTDVRNIPSGLQGWWTSGKHPKAP
jgi:uncharacterized protein YndB with AHSA1/START domain